MSAKRLRWLAVVFLLGCTAGAVAAPVPPAALLQELYARVELEQLFPDSKTFADAVPRQDPAAILAEYRSHRYSREELLAFVGRNFDLSQQQAPVAVQDLP